MTTLAPTIPTPKPRRYTYTPTADERRLLRNLAAARNHKPNVPNYRIKPTRSDEDTHYLGLCAEYAAARILGVPLDMSISLHGDNHAGDLVIPKKHGTLTAQVKYRNQRGWAFALTGADPAEFQADVGILCWPHGNGVELVGWMSRSKFVRVAIVNDYGYGARLAVEAHQMASITDLILEINGYRFTLDSDG